METPLSSITYACPLFDAGKVACKAQVAQEDTQADWSIPTAVAVPQADSLSTKQCSVADVMQSFNCANIGGSEQALIQYAQARILQHGLQDTFYVVDLGVVQRLYAGWCQAMPRVTPFYAVKCNTNLAMMAVLAALGAGFDCASEAECEAVLKLGVPAERIIYAHPCKPPAHIKYAATRGVNLTTFDSESELHKLAQWHPGTQALLRIRADDPHARCPLGNKYGAEPSEAAALLATARALGLAVVGVSFHVGSGATNPQAFTTAISLARQVFDVAASLGFSLSLLDLGGGFSGGCFNAAGEVDLGAVPAAVNDALAQHFPEASGVRIIAEPGRYFAEASASLFCCVYGQRIRHAPQDGQTIDYWLSDGLYGSLNCKLYDHYTPGVQPVRCPALPPVEPTAEATTCPSTLFGPTCDGLDTILRDHPLPCLRNGDYVMFPKMGAYTIAGAVDFNGFNVTKVPFFYVTSL